MNDKQNKTKKPTYAYAVFLHVCLAVQTAQSV